MTDAAGDAHDVGDTIGGNANKCDDANIPFQTKKKCKKM